jgi:hypothetical protein
VAGGGPTEAGVPDAAAPLDGEEPDAGPAVPLPHAATSIVAITAAASVRQRRIFTCSSRLKAPRPAVERGGTVPSHQPTTIGNRGIRTTLAR